MLKSGKILPNLTSFFTQNSSKSVIYNGAGSKKIGINLGAPASCRHERAAFE
jgi:hypothetical protein